MAVWSACSAQRFVHIVGLFVVLFLIRADVFCGERAPANLAPAPVLSWPKTFQQGDNRVVFYQPQIDEWQAYSVLRARCAVEVRFAGDANALFGAVYLEAKTKVNTEERKVLLSDLQITQAHFPQAPKEREAAGEALIRSVVFAQKSLLVSLDHMIAVTEKPDLQKEVPASFEPPQLFFSSKPAILVGFMGKPNFKLVKEAGLLFAVNTNWDVFLDPATSEYYLLNGAAWLTTKDVLKGPWTPVDALPPAFSKLPADENWDTVRKNIPGQRADAVPAIFTSTAPAELIVTAGEPNYEPIPGTSLMLVTNTESDLFMRSGPEGLRYYLLLAGRWFQAPSLDGVWSSARTDLPADFAKIPEDSDAADVLMSVPGTLDAEAAAMLASVPTKATVKRNQMALLVDYDGEPVFKPIEGTALSYAVNTSYSVLMANGAYYCCYQGVWFDAARPTGPWAVADRIPQVIYSIPATSPLHNVTYVTIYESNDTEVTTGYTGGYTGEYVVGGLVLFGLGLAIGHHWDDSWGSYHYASHYYSYGVSARFSYSSGGYVRASAVGVYGPYGGVGRVAAYNSQTGTYVRGVKAYGPAGSASAAFAFNPDNGTAAGRIGGSSVYGSWGRSAVTDGDDWARAGHHSGANGGVAGIETSGGAGLIAAEGPRGNTGGVAKDGQGSVLVGKDGNLYKKDESGSWQKYQDGNWQPVDRTQERPEPRAGTPSAERGEGAPAAARVENSPAGEQLEQRRDAAGSDPRQDRPAPADRQTPVERRDTRETQEARDRTRSLPEQRPTQNYNVDQLDRDSSRRDRGNERAQSFDNSRSSDRSGGSSGSGRSRGRR